MDIYNLIEQTKIIKPNKPDPKEYFCLFCSSELINISICWKYNRTLERDKINEIKRYVTDKSILDSVIYFYLHNDNLICYDGNHRLQALKDLYNETCLDIKVLCYINIPQTNSIDIEIRDHFNLLNTNTPIPDIYLEIINNLNDKTDTTDIILGKYNKILELNKRKDIIEQAFCHYKQTYKTFYKISNKPKKTKF